MKNLKYIILFILLGVGIGFGAKAEISIVSFDSFMELKEDATIGVTETIVVDFGDEQKHGIYRDIPYKYQNEMGNYSVRITVKSVRDENGKPYKFEVSSSGDDRRIKIGDEYILVSGKMSYVIDYEAIGAINFFEDHDELYWNVTGDRWPYAMNNISASVLLPAPLDENEVQKKCFAGSPGSSDPCDKANFLIDNSQAKEVRFAQDSLSSYQGLTAVIGIPKGYITPPSMIDRVLTLLKDNIILALPLFVLGALIYIWRRVGKDPLGAGTIIHQYNAPDGLSPAEIGVIIDERVDNYEISADIIDLAVKGYLRITKTEGSQLIFKKDDYLFEKLKDGSNIANKSQKLLLEKIFSSAEKSEEPVQAGKSEVLASIKLSDLKDKFYKDLKEIKNELYDDITAKGYFSNNPESVRTRYIIVGVVFVMGAFLLGGPFGFLTGISLVASGVLVIIFSFIMPKRTARGVIAKEHILGFKRYLSVAEKDRIEFHNAPEKNPKLFEKLLPYAMALKVEKEWAKQFEGIYQGKPDWYRDPTTDHFTPALFASTMSNFTSEANSALASSPSSAASGGSGFSGGGVGGGFGGGGGGSW